jgi:hypothetical protein
VNKVEEYRRLAAQCIRMAQDADAATAKVTLIDMASYWIKLAEQSDRSSQAGRVRAVHWSGLTTTGL